jgi:hypothetical protein
MLLCHFREEVVPLMLQEAVNERDRFRVFQACALITEQEARRELAADGTLGRFYLNFAQMPHTVLYKIFVGRLRHPWLVLAKFCANAAHSFLIKNSEHGILGWSIIIAQMPHTVFLF